MSFSLMVSTVDQRVVWVSDSFADCIGLPPEQLTGRSVFDLLDGSSNDAWFQLFTRTKSSDERFDHFGVRVAGNTEAADLFNLSGVRYVDGGRSVMLSLRVAPTETEWENNDAFVTDVVAAMRSGDIYVAYQPIVDIRSGALKKLEALARWTHPQRGPIGPDVFIPWAERTGMIHELGEWILERSCHDLVRMGGEGIQVDLSVNVSVDQLRRSDVAQRFSDVIARARLSPDRVWLEVTESVLLDDDALSLLMAIHSLGVRLVIDDFGTGHANFHYLTRLVVDSLKIDTSFVAGLGTESRATAIVRSVLSLGRELGLEIVAEGIENESQRSQLLDLNCQLGQGWLFSPALPYDQLVVMYAPSHTLPKSFVVGTEGLPGDIEAVRLKVLRSCRILDTDADPAFDSLAQLASQLLSAPIALISLVDTDRQWFKARLGTDLPEVARSHSIVWPAEAPSDEPAVINDTTEDEHFGQHPLVMAIPSARVCAEAVIRSREGLPLGTFSVVDTRLRTFTPRELGQLTLLAEQASELLDLRRRAVELDDLYIGARHGGRAGQSVGDPRIGVDAPGNGALAQLTRVAGRRTPPAIINVNSLEFDGLALDLTNRRLAVEGLLVEAPAKEFDLLAFLAARPGQVFTRAELLQHVWNSKPEWQNLGTVTEHIHRLRGKIEIDPNRPRFLRTVRGKGYLFETTAPRTTVANVAASQSGTWIHVDNRVVAADDGMVELLAAQRSAELIGRQVAEFVVPASKPAAQAAYEMRAAGHSPGPQVLTLRAIDGTERLCLITTDVGEFGGVPAVIGIAREIVDAPRLMRQMISGVIAEVSDAVVVTDPDLRVLSWNPAAARLYGWSEQEVLGHTLQAVVGDDPDFHGGAPWNELLLNGSWTGVMRQRARDGTTVSVASSANLLRERGDIIGIALVNRLVPLGISAVEKTEEMSTTLTAACPPAHVTEQFRLSALGSSGALDMAPDAALNALTRLTARLMETPIAAVSIIGRDRQWFLSSVGVEMTNTRRDASFSSSAIATPGEVFVVNDTALDERFVDSPFVVGSPFARSYAAMHICSSEGLAYGTLNVIDIKPREFTEQQIGFLKVLALQAAALLDLRRRTGELDALIFEQAAERPADTHLSVARSDLSVELSRGTTATLTRVHSRLMTATGDRTDVDPEASILRLAATRSLLRSEAVEEAVGVVIGLVRDLGGSTIPARLGDRSALPIDCSFGHGEPLLARPDSVLARLRIERILPEVLDDAREAISRLRQRDDLAELSHTDPLTGLLNRRAVDPLLTRLHPDDALIVIDLDKFKPVNDRWGHGAGDELLIAFARALRSHCRPGDQFGRLGGDELLAVLFGAGRAGLDSFLNRLHETWLIVRPREVTYSAGAALVNGRTGIETLTAADASLYRAKELGRDQVAVDTTPMPPLADATVRENSK
jgi:diguanylate cyclase (GGDEF)-like protein/PAS domain S-box-containing protein